MLSKISWGQFFSAIIFLAVVYYFVIVILYYQKDILKWSRHGLSLGNFSKQSAFINATENAGNIGTSKEQLRPMSYNEFTAGDEEHDSKQHATGQNVQEKINYSEVHELMEDLEAIFISSAKKKLIKHELIQSVRNKLSQYKQIKGTEIEHEINEHIKNECSEKCAIELDLAELQNLWKL